MHRSFTYANVASTLALALAVGGGSAYAASQITSKSIKDGTIQTKDLSAKARKSLKGKTGGTGATGAAGAAGPVGVKGDAGPKGDPGVKGDAGAKGDPGTPAVLKRSTLPYSDQADTATTGVGYAKVRDIGTIAKDQAATTIRLTLAESVKVSGGAGYCTYQLRIDGVNALGSTTNFDGTEATTRLLDATPVTLVTTFSGLSAGDHTASLWARGSSAGTCSTNVGNFPRRLIVEEGI